MNSLEKIKQDIIEAKLPLSENNLVFGRGSPNANILFIGEAPGAKEDKLGIPFVGSAGKELEKLLNSINVNIEDIYIANILKYRPPNNRNPNVLEIKSHTPFLVRQIKIINPKIICTLGNFATKFVLSGFNVKEMKKIEGIASIHGTLHKLKIADKEVIVIPLYHPAAMLYNPKLRPILSEDFKIIQKII
jgi:uracil-DNA glycosylase